LTADAGWMGNWDNVQSVEHLGRWLAADG